MIVNDQEPGRDVAMGVHPLNLSLRAPHNKSSVRAQAGSLKEFFKWESPARPFKKRNKKFYGNLGLMLFIIALVALFLQEFFLIAVLMAIFFYYYVAGTVEPVTIKHRITNRGITTTEHEYPYKELSDFWFSEKYNETILNLSTKVRYPARIFMLLPYKDKEKVRKTLTEYLTFKETAPISWTDRLLDWANAKLPASMR